MFIYDPYNIRTFYFQSISNSLLQVSDPIYMLIQRKYTPKLPKSKTDITYSWFTKISSYFLSTLILTAVSHYTPIDTSVIYTRAHARRLRQYCKQTSITIDPKIPKHVGAAFQNMSLASFPHFSSSFGFR